MPTLARMSGFAVGLSSVQQTASVTSSIGADLGAELGRLRRDADNLLAGDWRGSAANAFDRAWCGWDAGAREVVVALDRLAELLTVSAREYALRDLVSGEELRRAAS
jgi:WXG100 family type VII secretion target